MTKAHVNKLDDQDLSALLDGEEFLTDQEIAAKESATLGRYALIGDVMRAESEDDFVLDISDSVAKALESEPVYADFSQKQNTEQTTQASDNVVAFNWRRPVAQLAIAASVAMFAIVGVQTLPQGDDSPMNEIPMLQSTPLTGVASPVSYSSEPALENAEKGFRELQQQRIGALVLEHQRQARVAYSLEKAQTKAQAEEEKK
ncbi:MAG: sigma-E factor negative regulatory protein [Pseudoalteromonas sp.]|uniref:sigma-E factor negative regulatory protein n=1 Tax=unclassified Pseudoalteromonas TaxID=194690 RepID=UPI000C08BF98|nr:MULTISPECIES: RseA family anti-sigma factor [unclassified Pseudoalteromonas]MDB2356292.1 RseA family anti-sigma factor [Pseudoalteromonas sp.]MDP2633841.1 RseA family anti-sigma factor [Pseudoalteromonas sp. 1_MG-2023]PHN89000.1 metal ABC transporter ATP-binding protein [Pseudoalteromonas sp. 3D05]TGE85541.1 metal ABC transporter ATP-binding protein [Pseudoalteromonas sp. KS88]